MKKTLISLTAGWVVLGNLAIQSQDSPRAAERPQRGLVLHFTFDTAEPGGKVTDSSGQGNHGQAVNANWTPAGHQGGGFQLGPVSSYISVPNSDSLNTEKVTLAVWIKTARHDQFWRRIVDKGQTLGYALTVVGEFRGRHGQAHMMFNGYQHTSFSGFPVSDGQWHHLAATYDGSEQILFVDGKPVGRPVRWKGVIAANNDNLTIGLRMSENWKSDAATDHGKASFDGVLDDVMIFNRALLPTEIKTLFIAQGGVLALEPALTSSTASPTKPDAAERLKKVKALYDQGLINKEDYDKKVKEIMDSL